MELEEGVGNTIVEELELEVVKTVEAVAADGTDGGPAPICL